MREGRFRHVSSVRIDFGLERLLCIFSKGLYRRE